MLLPFTKKDHDRRIFINAIGPVWDGNEVWLVIVMGTLFAGFPFVYAKLLSSFNTPIMLLIFALIFRAVAIEFRSKRPSKIWRGMWDFFFSAGSTLIAFAVGVGLGNFVHGIPLDANFNYTGGVFLTYFRPYPLLVGFLTLALFAFHGSVFLLMKTEGELHDKIVGWIKPCMALFLFFYVITTAVTFIFEFHFVERFFKYPLMFLLPALHLVIIGWIYRCVKKQHYGWAFLTSCANIAMLLILFACGLFPNLLRSSVDPAYSLTLFNSSSSLKTLQVLAVIVAIGLPLVVAYTSYIYKVFHGKVILDDHSY
jgi:cytochrome d ubiquinol oxidase subunit II